MSSLARTQLSYVHILTTTETGSTSSTAATFDFSVADDKEAECDKCLVGVWEHVIALSDYWDAVREGTANRPAQLESVSGLHMLTFYEGGAYESATEGFQLVWRSARVGGNSTIVRTTAEQSAIGTWLTSDGTNLQLIEEDSNIRQEDVTVVSGPLGTFQSDPVVTEGGPGHLPPVAQGTPYTCTDTTLRYYSEDPNWGWSGYLEFDRLTSDPSEMIGPWIRRGRPTTIVHRPFPAWQSSRSSQIPTVDGGRPTIHKGRIPELATGDRPTSIVQRLFPAWQSLHSQRLRTHTCVLGAPRGSPPCHQASALTAEMMCAA